MNKELWEKVRIKIKSNQKEIINVLKDGQYEALLRISESLLNGGVILADEVGLGKTFVALALVENIIECGGTVGIVVPPGLLFQWEGEIKKFRKLMKLAEEKDSDRFNLPIKKLRNFNDFISDETFNRKTFEYEPLIKKNKSPILLISHNFNTRQVKINSPIDSIHLPTLYFGACNMKNTSESNSTYWNQLSKYEDYHGTMKICEYLKRANINWSVEEKEYIENEENRVFKRYVSVKGSIIETFKKGNIGDRIQKKLVGHAIGKLDLVIIDEAHKSKGDGDISSSILGNLLGNILNPMISEDNYFRVLGMTATPVEMSSSQWNFILERVCISKKERELKNNSIMNFSKSLINAKRYPDTEVAISELIHQSKKFEECLEDNVFRRRKCELDSYKNFIQNSNFKNSSHPHRIIKNVVIKLDDLDFKWKKSILAFEGVSKAAKGMHVNNLLKILDKRYASGLIGKEIISSNFKKGEDNQDISPNEKAQLGRIEFWKNLHKESGDLESSDDVYLNSHPRVQKGADHIEKIIFSKDAFISDEKVLIFGTFTRPLRALRDVVNMRFILRQIDNENFVKCPPKDSPVVAELYEEYKRVKAKKDEKLQFKNKLNKEMNLARFEIIINESRTKYNGIHHKLTEYFKEFKGKNEGREFYESLPGSKVLAEFSKNKDIKRFYSFLQDYILTEMVHDEEILSIYLNEGKNKNEKIMIIAIHVWNSFIQGLIAELDEIESSEEAGNSVEYLTVSHIESILNEDDEMKKTTRSNFCRFMDGSTSMKVRRVIQSQFNNSLGMPRVLIAQSMVGREGLNLHEACRKIVVFHPEWNPAVIEQQIGRVDRIDSRWEKMIKEYIARPNNSSLNFPYIEIDFLVFEGTYDQHQFEKMKLRRDNLNAQLFGALLPEECLEKVPPDLRDSLAKAAPNFSPLKKKKHK